jgi:hypothetical protein
MITGTFFGELAEFRRNKIERGQIYRISRGKVIQDKYLKHLNEKSSKYSLLFNKDTEMINVKDVPIIPYATNNWLRLSEAFELPHSEELYNFVGMLVEVEEEKHI